MLFSRTYRYQSTIPLEDIRSRLVGKRVKVHNLDFEVMEKDMQLKIIPHAEQIESLKTLPITHIKLANGGSKTQVVIRAKMRKIDQGGPLLIVIFCSFMLLAGIIGFIAGHQEYSTYIYTFFGLGLLIFIVFWLRMERGYFDYVRKLRDYVKRESVA
jgi:hypothetical protein